MPSEFKREHKQRGIKLNSINYFILFLLCVFMPLCLLLLFSLFSPSTASEDAVAVLSRLKNDVQVRRAEDLSWEGASEDMEIFTFDRIMTAAASYAELKYMEGGSLFIEEKSMIVIKLVDIKKDLRKREFELSDGKIKGEVKGDENGDEILLIKTPPADIELNSKDNAGRTAAVNIDVTDNKTHVSVNTGMAKISSRGKTYQIFKDEEGVFSSTDNPVIRQISKEKNSIQYSKFIPVGLLATFLIASFVVYKFALKG